MKINYWFSAVLAVTLLSVGGCSKDEPVIDYNQLEAEYWGSEVPHCFLEEIDSIYILEQNSDGYIYRINSKTGEESIKYPDTDNQTSVKFTICLVGKNKIDPVRNPKRYSAICQTIGARPRSRRVNIPEINALPQFTILNTPDKQLINSRLARIDVTCNQDLKYKPDNVTVSAGEKLPDFTSFTLQSFQALVNQIVRCGQEYDFGQELLNNINFWSSREIENQSTSLFSPYIQASCSLRDVSWVVPSGDYTFKCIVSIEGHEPIETEFKILVSK